MQHLIQPTLAFFLLSVSALAQTSLPTDQKKIGTITGITQGDVACYLTLRDDQGKMFDEMGDFDLCLQEKVLLGKRVRLNYTTANVLADECEGNPDCQKSKQVMLVETVEILSNPSLDSRPTFCTPSEITLFECARDNQLVSVCLNASSLLQLRFGSPTAPQPLKQVVSSVRFQNLSGHTESYSGGGAAWLRFYTPSESHVIYTGIGKWGQNGETIEKQGWVVEKSGKAQEVFECSSPATSLLGPDWFDAHHIQAHGEEFYLPE